MKKSLIYGSLVALASMAILATTVFACTNFIGTFTVNGSGGGTVTATGNDTCTSYNPASGCTFGMSQSLSSSTSASHSTGTFTINWTVSHTIALAIHGTYDVNFVGGDAYNNNMTPWQIDCMDGSTGITKVGTATLSSTTNSTGNNTYNVPSGSAANASGQESAVCISDSAANFGNEAPIALT